MLLDKVKHILCISLILLVGVTTLYACKSDDKELQGEPVLQVQKSIGFKKEGGEVAVPVKSNREWNASVTEGKEWLTARKASDTELTVSATSSPEKGVREGNITIANNALTAKLRVVQTSLKWLKRAVSFRWREQETIIWKSTCFPIQTMK